MSEQQSKPKRVEMWHGDNSRRIDGRIVVECDLVLETPALFSNGDSDDLRDMTLLRDAKENKPLLTGTTLAGALRAALVARQQGYRTVETQYVASLPDQTEKKTRGIASLLFGAVKGDDNGYQSALIVDDALGETAGVEWRDGVKLDPKTRTAEEKKLFNLEAWPAGTRFHLRFELLLLNPRERPKGINDSADYQAQQKKAFYTMLDALANDGLTLGGRKHRGYGRFEIENWRLREYNLHQPNDLLSWLQEGGKALSADHTTTIEKIKEGSDSADKRKYFTLNATFSLEGSLLIRGNAKTDGPDMVHLTNHAKQPILSGTSVAGALRQQARRILSVVRPNDPPFLDDLFGVDAKASRLTVEETKIEEPQFDLVQNRVAIDRFTGGALDSALFNEQPVFGTSETRLHINLRVINPTDGDIGLLLLLLKDLWTGLLPLGGEISVGRGRLKGESAEMVLQQNGKKESFSIKSNGEALDIKPSAERLQQFLDALWKEAKNE